MSIYLVIGIVVWIYLLSVLKRAHVPAFFFLIGTGGLFFILIGFSDPYWVWFFTHSVINGVKWFGNLTNMSEVMNRYGLISIIVHFAGGSAFFIGHSIIGRMVFYILVIALYYNVFTYSQISHSLYQNFRRFITRIKKRLSKEG